MTDRIMFWTHDPLCSIDQSRNVVHWHCAQKWRAPVAALVSQPLQFFVTWRLKPCPRRQLKGTVERPRRSFDDTPRTNKCMGKTHHCFKTSKNTNVRAEEGEQKPVIVLFAVSMFPSLLTVIACHYVVWTVRHSSRKTGSHFIVSCFSHVH